MPLLKASCVTNKKRPLVAKWHGCHHRGKVGLDLCVGKRTDVSLHPKGGEYTQSDVFSHVAALPADGARPQPPSSRQEMEALHAAASAGDVPDVDMALRAGCEVHVQDESGRSALMLARPMDMLKL